MACCTAKKAGIGWHMSVSSMKPVGVRSTSLGETDNSEKPDSSRSPSQSCYPEVNQALRHTRPDGDESPGDRGKGLQPGLLSRNRSVRMQAVRPLGLCG